MNDDHVDDSLDDFQPPPRPDHHGEQFTFGAIEYPWRTPAPFDGPQSPAPRRPELLGDMEDAWWADVRAWTEWAIATFRLSRWFPPCWPRHRALVEEAQALWLLWCEAWMPGIAPSMPTQFLYHLSIALGRVDTYWQIPCTPDTHSEPTPIRPSAPIRPATSDWWSLDTFDPTTPAW